MPAAATQPTGKRSKRGRLSEGAPTLRTKALTDSIAESISLGLTDEESALIAGIKPETLCRWRRIPEFDQALKRATAIRLRDRLLLINARVENWQAIGWLIERQFPTRFSKPEVQISLSNSFNQTVNALSITISAEEAQEIEAKAELNRAKVRELFSQYRPSPRNSEQDASSSVPISVQEKFANYRPASGNGR
jgi:hypothetical protein